ncbi:MAG: TolC family protein [Undibacterium sp.]|nr:TolC family protein [Opitutaceae bacterium]
MQLSFRTLWVGLVVGGAAALGQTQVEPWSLAKALDAVEGANVNVLLSREAAVQALAAANQQRVGLLPNVGLSAQQRRAESVSVSSGGTLTQTSAANRFDGRLVGNVSILNPQQIAAYRASRAGVAVAEADYRATVQSVMSSVAQYYFTHLRNLRRIDVLDANIARSRALVELARNQLAAGVATQIDVTRAESLLAQAEQARLQQDTVVYQSALLLQRLLDLNPARTLTLTDFQVQRENAGAFTEGLEETTFTKRADWLRAQKALEQAKLDVKTAKFERLPILGLGGEYGYVAAEIFDSTTKQAWFAGATVTMPIFDGLKSSADQRAALSRQRSQAARLKNLELQISTELRFAQQDASSRNAQITVAEKTLRLAEQELQLAQKRFQQGVADNREIIEAQNRLAIASDGLVEAVYLYNLSRVELARSKGEVRGILAERVP